MSKPSEVEIQSSAEAIPATEPVHVRHAHTWAGTFWQIVRFSMVGALNTVIDVCVLNVLLWRFPTHNSNLLLLYNSIAFALGAVNSFGLNKYWTFRRRQRSTGRELLFFIAINAFGIICNDTLFWTATNLLHPLISNSFLWVNTSKGIAAVGTALISYLGMRLLVFSAKSKIPRGTDPRRGHDQSVPTSFVG